MKKLSVILTTLIILTASSFAQKPVITGKSKFSAGVFGGINLPRLSGGNDNELSRDYTSRSGAAFGVSLSVYLGSNFFLRLDGLYSSEGGKRNGIQAFDASTINPLAPAGNYFYAIYDNESILNYFEMPLLIKYNFPLNKSSKFFLDFGPYVGFLLNAKQETKGSSLIFADREQTVVISPVAQSFDANTDITNDINTTNFGLTGGGGVSTRVGSAGEVFIDIRGAYGLTTIQKEKQNGSSHTGNLLVDLGYALHF